MKLSRRDFIKTNAAAATAAAAGVSLPGVSGVLAGEVVVLLVMLPVEVRVQVLGLLQGVGDVALGHPQAPRQQGGHQVAVRIVADDQVRSSTQFGEQFLYYGGLKVYTTIDQRLQSAAVAAMGRTCPSRARSRTPSTSSSRQADVSPARDQSHARSWS